MKRYILLLSLLLYGCSNPAEPKDYRWKMGDDDTPTEVILPPPCIPDVICKPITQRTTGLQIYKCTATDPCSGATSSWQVVQVYQWQDDCLGYNVDTGRTWYQPCPR